MFDHRTVVPPLEGPWSCLLLTNHTLGVGQRKHLAHPKDANSTHGVGVKGKNHGLGRPMPPSGSDFGDKVLHPTRYFLGLLLLGFIII